MRKGIVVLPFLLLLLISAVGGRADGDKQSLTAAEIISKHLTSVGGKEKLAQFKTRAAIGTLKKEDESNIRMVIASESGHKVAAIYRFERYDLRMSYDGTKVNIRPIFSREFSVINDKYQEMLASGLMFNSISLYNLLIDNAASNLKFEAKGIKKLHGRPTYIVDVRRSNSVPMRVYFDAEDFMWVRTDYGKVTLKKYQGAFTNDVVSHAEDDTPVDFYIETSDFRDVDGVKLPFKFEQVVTSPILRQKLVGTITGTILQYQHNIPIDPKFYQ